MSTTFLEDEEDVHTLIIIPPDGGWGYMVVFSTFIIFYITDGISYSVGVFLQPIMNEFGTPMSDTSLIGSAIYSITAIVGPFVSACMNNYDARCLCITACILSGIALAISALTTSFIILLVANGVLLGIGFGMLYIPSLIMTNIYFSRYRAIALGIATCGSGIGSLSFSQVATELVKRIGWRNTYFFMIGLLGIAALASLAFIPLKPIQIKHIKSIQNTNVQSKVSLARFSKRCLACCRWRNKHFPTANELVLAEKGDLDQITYSPFVLEDLPPSGSTTSSLKHSKTRFLSAISMAVDRTNDCWFSFLSCLCSECCQIHQRAMYRQDIFFQGSAAHFKKYKYNALHAKKRIHKKTIRKLKEDKIKIEKEKREHRRHELLDNKKKLQEDKAKVTKERMRLQEEMAKEPPDGGDKVKIAKRAQTIEKIKKLQNLENHFEQEILAITNILEERALTKEEEDEERHIRSIEYNMSITHVTTARELFKTARCSCGIGTLRALTTMLDFHVLRSFAFILICLNSFFFSLGYYIPWMFIAERAEEAGISHDSSIMLITYIGAANTVGRFLSGFFSFWPRTNYALLIGICCIVQGIVTVFSGYFMMYWGQLTFSLFFGFLAAPSHSVKTLMISELFGIERLSSLFGLQLVGYGIAALIGTPLAGFLRDRSQNFHHTFYFSGSCLTLCGLILLFVHPVRRWEIRKDYVDF